MPIAHVGPKGQVVVPKALRDALHIRPGDTVVVEAHDGHLVLTPVPHRTARDLRGVLHGRAPIDLQAGRQAYQDHLVDKWDAERRDGD